MRKRMRGGVVLGAVVAASLILAACGSSDSSSSTDNGGGSGGPTGSITVAGRNPQNPLVPSNTTETCGGNVIERLRQAGPLQPRDRQAENDIAESIETTDNQNFTVKLKPGYKFQDGTEVTSKNFVDAWNYAAYGPNAQSTGYFMAPIEGFDAMNPAAAADECDGQAQGQRADRPEGRRRHDLHHQDHREGPRTFPVAARLLGLLPAARRRSSRTPRPSATSRSAPARTSSTRGPRTQEIKLSKFADYSASSPASRRSRRQLQDLPGPRRRLQRRHRQQPRRHRRDPASSALIDDKYKTDLPDRNAQKAVRSSRP